MCTSDIYRHRSCSYFRKYTHFVDTTLLILPSLEKRAKTMTDYDDPLNTDTTIITRPPCYRDYTDSAAVTRHVTVHTRAMNVSSGPMITLCVHYKTPVMNGAELPTTRNLRHDSLKQNEVKSDKWSYAL